MKALLLSLVCVLFPAYSSASLYKQAEFPLADYGRTLILEPPTEGDIYTDENTKYFVDGKKVDMIEAGDYTIQKVKFRYLRVVGELWLKSSGFNIAPMPHTKPRID